MTANSKLYTRDTDEEEELRTSEEIFIDYFRERDIEEVRRMLGALLYVALTRDSEEFDDGIKRDDAIFFCRQTDDLLTALNKYVQERKPTYNNLQS